MENWIPPKNTIRITAAAATLCLVLYILAWLAVDGAIRKSENLYQSTESEVYKEEKSWAIKSAVEANKELIGTLRGFIVPKGDEVKFIETIEEAARLAGTKFEIESIDVKGDEANTYKENIKTKARFEGSWKNIFALMNRLEKLPFGISVQNANFDAQASGWAGSIEFVVFREK